MPKTELITKKIAQKISEFSPVIFEEQNFFAEELYRNILATGAVALRYGVSTGALNIEETERAKFWYIVEKPNVDEKYGNFHQRPKIFETVLLLNFLESWGWLNTQMGM